MVLSPQCFHNLNLHTDIFNHSNVHFWEYMQPGYDALGFISCTGTNFLVRRMQPHNFATPHQTIEQLRPSAPPTRSCCMRVVIAKCRSSDTYLYWFIQVRSNALLEVGGSPTWTLTEDYALGMQLKKFGWHCRYVQEYLAIGEAPDQIRNCYQQRSRWCKVCHFVRALLLWLPCIPGAINICTTAATAD